MTDFEGLLRALEAADADFILVGGVAAVAHGGTRLTQDLDVVYLRERDAMDRLVEGLGDLSPYLRGAPPGLPFDWSRETLERGLNFTLTTDLGDIDLLGEITGGGTYQDLLPRTVEIEVFGMRCRCLDLPTLIDVKRAAGRPKDLEAIAELEVLRDECAPSTADN